MKITVEYQGYPHHECPKIAVYEEKEGDSPVDHDWDFLFESLGNYLEILKVRVKREDSLGRKLVVQAKIDQLEKLFKKYVAFIQIAEEDRYDI